MPCRAYNRLGCTGGCTCSRIRKFCWPTANSPTTRTTPCSRAPRTHRGVCSADFALDARGR
eukprot:12899208-Prorocentrum_lima.AAC.1